jgi:acylphosphatase
MNWSLSFCLLGFLFSRKKENVILLAFENLDKWLLGLSMNLAKARIVVDGVVQGVGYRALVKQVARQLGLKGLIRNLEDTKVEIFCEGVKDKIEEFLKKIDRKAKPEDFLSINVSEIKCFFERDPNYKPTWKPYKEFEIDYGVEELSTIDKATLEGHEFGKLYFIGFKDEMKGFGEELKGFRQDTNISFKEMAENYENTSKELEGFGSELKGFREDTNKNFKDMAEKYGDISKELKEFRKTVKEFLEAFLSEYQKRTQA